MTPVRADIVGAESLVIYDGSGSRGGGYEFERAGLYKIDKDGNVSAVGIFVKKNGKTKEEPLSVRPESMKTLGENYIIMQRCGLYGDNGESLGIIMDLLVNKATGMIYLLNDEVNYYCSYLNIYGKELSLNTLLLWGYDTYKWDDLSPLLRVNISGNGAICSVLNFQEGKEPYGFYTSDGGHVVVLDNGTILSQSDFGQVAMLFPNGGYDYLKDIVNSLGIGSLGIGSLDINGLFAGQVLNGLVLNNGCSIINLDNNLKWYNVTVGTQQGQYEVELADEITWPSSWSNLYVYTYIETAKDVIVSSTCNFVLSSDGYFPLMLVYNKSTKKMSTFTTNFTEGTVMNLSPNCCFDGRAWDVRDKKAYWLNLSTFDSGSFDFNLDGIDVSSVEPYYSAGQVVFYGIRRSDASAVVATVDLATEKVEIRFTPRDVTSIRLIPLN